MMKDFVKSILYILLYYFIYSFICSLFIDSINDKFLIDIISSIIPLIYIIFKNYKAFKDSIIEFDFKKFFKKYLIIGIISIIIMNIISVIINSTTNILVTNEQTIRTYLKQSNFIFPFIATGIIAPFIEEFLFRYNFRKLNKHKWLFIIITGVLFSSIHIISIQNYIELLYLIPYLIMGFTLSYIFSDSDNIFNSFFVHSLNNIGTLIILIIMGVI